jgi:hypothetical protein
MTSLDTKPTREASVDNSDAVYTFTTDASLVGFVSNDVI